MLGIPLINPISETHHLLYLLPAVVIVAKGALIEARRYWTIGIVTFAVVVGALLGGRYFDPAAALAVFALYASLFLIMRGESIPG
jgi:hypothetical protein